MCYSRNMIVSSRQTVYALKDNAYLCIKGVDFAGGTSTPTVKVEVAPDHKGGSIEFRAGNFANGELLAKVEVGEETTATAAFTAPTDKLSDLFVVLSGDVELVSWVIDQYL